MEREKELEKVGSMGNVKLEIAGKSNEWTIVTSIFSPKLNNYGVKKLTKMSQIFNN